jgi:nucleoside-diphosphate-sugar epimerase
MKILVTGASGYIGNKLSNVLASKGYFVHALIRNSSAEPFLQHPNIRIFKGDILDNESLSAAMKGCKQVFHVAASVKVRTKYPGEIMRINTGGTRNVLQAAADAGVSKIVFTSSGGVLGHSLNGPLTEDDPRLTSFELEYEVSKKMAEDVVLEYVKNGMNVVIVRPTKVYGPGHFIHTLSSNAVINRFLTKGYIIIPGPQNYSTNFTFLDDVVEGHYLAMEKGQSGEKYLIGGENVSYFQFFDVARKFNDGKGKIIIANKWVIMSWAFLQEAWQKISGKEPFIIRKTARYLFNNREFSSQKAVNKLGYKITPFEEGMRITVDYLKTKNYGLQFQ